MVGSDGDDGNTGSAYVFSVDGSDWTQQAKLTASDSAPHDQFGIAVATGGDTILVGAHYDDEAGADSGSAYVFVRSGTTWSQQAKLTPSDAAAGDMFGYAVAINGDTAVVGAYGDDDGGSMAGSAYVFTRDGSTWNQQAKLVPSDSEAGNAFGYAVAIDGETILVGAHQPPVGGSGVGAAYVFTWNGSTWNEQQKLEALGPTIGEQFGCAVSVAGDTAVIGARGLYDHSLGFACFYGSAAYVFVRDGSSWDQQAKLTPSDAAAWDAFGYSVSVSVNTVLVGAYASDELVADSGSAYVFHRPPLGWADMTETAKLIGSDTASGDEFGYSVSLSGDTAVVGAPDDADAGSDSGSAYVFNLVDDDCNCNGAADVCDIADGTSEDLNDNGIPDECENQPPVCDIVDPEPTECAGATTDIPLDGSVSSDPDDDSLTYWWESDCPQAEFDDPTIAMPTMTVSTLAPCPLQCDVTLTVDDGILTDTCSVSLTVEDTSAPTITCPDEMTVECDGSGNLAELDAWLDSAMATDVCGDVTMTNNFVGLSDDCAATGSTTVTWTATDDCSLTSTCSATFTIEDTSPPAITVPEPLTIEVDGCNLWGVPSSDPAIAAWLDSASGADMCGEVTLTHDAPDTFPADCLPGAITTVTFTATDDCGNSASDSSTVTIARPAVEETDVRTQGFWRRVCQGPHPTGEFENLFAYVDFVGTFATFWSVADVDDVCDTLYVHHEGKHPSKEDKKCLQAEAQFMAMLLNLASCRAGLCNLVDDPDLGAMSAGEVAELLDGMLSHPNRTFEQCVRAQAVADRFNNGDTLVDVAQPIVPLETKTPRAMSRN